ncbi:MAG: hypothetical protein WD834_06075, partial [Actinomycetota bacterium]
HGIVGAEARNVYTRREHPLRPVWTGPSRGTSSPAALERRAQEQRDRLEPVRLALASAAFGGRTE